MKLGVRKTIKEIKDYGKYYFVQSLLASLVIGIALLISGMHHLVIVASIGSTAFIVFMTPQKRIARPKNIIGGHLIGFFSGAFCAFFVPPHSESVVMYALAVGISMFFMALTDTRHPPASGTALGIAISGFSWDVFFCLLIGVVALSLAHVLFRNVIKDFSQ